MSTPNAVTTMLQASFSPVRNTSRIKVCLPPIRSTPSSPAPATPRQIHRAPPTSPPPTPRSGPLQHALLGNRVLEVARILDGNELASVAPIKDLSGCESPLVKAARYGCSVLILKLLLRHGANADSPGNNGLTPLMIVIRAHTNRLHDRMTYPDFSHGSADQPRTASMWPTWSQQIPLAGNNGLSESNLRDGLPRLSEDQCMDTALCLLQHGAEALQAGTTGQCAPDVAERLGKPRLAALLKYWCELQACRMLWILWHSYDGGHLKTGTISVVPGTVRSLLSQFMVPDELDYLHAVEF
mmetsp:Transcript_66769/g.131635  ORF Transcript_66769/g.131635 Transcript_66769/m.131635 type:complete len:298 (+) Transcript_66769:100-993(+)